MAVPKRKRSTSIVRIRKYYSQNDRACHATHSTVYCIFCNQWTSSAICKKSSCIQRRDDQMLSNGS